jgi:hypothetical protein
VHFGALDDLRGRTLGERSSRALLALAPASRAAQVHAREIAQHACEPRAQHGLRRSEWGTLQRDREGFLGHVGGGLVIARERASQSSDPGRLGEEELDVERLGCVRHGLGEMPRAMECDEPREFSRRLPRAWLPAAVRRVSRARLLARAPGAAME